MRGVIADITRDAATVFRSLTEVISNQADAGLRCIVAEAIRRATKLLDIAIAQLPSMTDANVRGAIVVRVKKAAAVLLGLTEKFINAADESVRWGMPETVYNATFILRIAIAQLPSAKNADARVIVVEAARDTMAVSEELIIVAMHNADLEEKVGISEGTKGEIQAIREALCIMGRGSEHHG